MGDYLNPSSPRYEKLKKSKVFVDKTDIFEILNENLGKEKSFFCLSRPRCFGKSVTAQMICSYYARCQDSSSLFDNLKIASFDDYKKHLNQYDVIFINMTDEFNDSSCDVNKMIASITKSVVGELKEAYPQIDFKSPDILHKTLKEVFSQSKVPFVIVID